MDSKHRPEPYEPGPELDAALREAEAREPRLIATIRDLLRDRERLMAELREAQALAAERGR